MSSDHVPLRLSVGDTLGAEFQCPGCSKWSLFDLHPDLLGMLQQPVEGEAVYELRCRTLGCTFQKVFTVKTPTRRLPPPSFIPECENDPTRHVWAHENGKVTAPMVCVNCQRVRGT